MATPESKVKAKVKDILERSGAYFFMPPMNGYGASGVPDIVACLNGRFIGVECKANGNKPTKLQMKNLEQIRDAGGWAFVVDETSIGLFAMSLSITPKGIPKGGTLYDYTGVITNTVSK